MQVECEEKGVRRDYIVYRFNGNIVNKFRLKYKNVKKVVHVINIFIV